ncbi:MAG: acetyl-CoA carboxylase biotin carboxyl carrier protein subunit [Synergistaceae bacterium]|nr:acetyl-CoA carboxylase biotin carboxyl carrier protein subunit [Synergistaceae bacterium]
MARKYRVTVNGKAYDVDVEEMGAGTSVVAPVPAAAPMAAAAPVAVPTPVAASVPAAPTPAPVAGGSVIEAPMPGKVLKILVSPGATVAAGQLVLILEAMKMENEIFAATAGTVTQIGCKEGDNVNTGDTLLVIG